MEGAAQKMLEFHANSLAYEQKMQALMRECKKGLQKDGDRAGKRSLREWIKVRTISNKESWVVALMKVLAVEAGIKLSHLLIDFVFMMSRQDEFAEKIWKFKSELKSVTEDGNFNSLVIDKVLILLEMAEEQVSEIKRSRELKNKGKVAIIKDSDQEERSSGRIRVHELVDQWFEQTLYQIFGQFLEAVLRLESIVSHPYLPADSEMLMKEALLMVESGLMQYEEVLEWIRGDIITLKKMFPLKLEIKRYAKTKETIISAACRIDDLWWGAMDNSSEEKDDISTNMEGEVQRRLTNAAKKMLDFRTNISGFETKMQALMRECKERLIKRAGNSEKNSSMGWMKASNTSNEESSSGSRSVITMKSRVVVAGIQLSTLVVDFVFMMSRRDELAEKIGEFKAAFEWATKLNSMVIDKVVNLLEIADREVRKMRRSKELKKKRMSVIDDGHRDERSNERIRVQELIDQFFKQILYQIFDQFLEAVLRLEFITSHPKLPDSGLQMEKALSMIECDVRHCETVVESLRQDIMALQTIFPFESKLEDAKMVEARNFVEPKIYKLWIGLLDFQPSLNEGVEELVEVEKEAKKPSNMDQLSAFSFFVFPP